MTESEIRKLIQSEVRRTVQQALMGVLVSTESQSRVGLRRLPNDGTIGNARRIQPYGLSSRAPDGMEALILAIHGDSSHPVHAGDFDAARPDTQTGETILYDQFGHVVYLSESKMTFGSKESSEPMVLGNVFKDMMSTLLDALANHTHVCGPPGFLSDFPANQLEFLSIKQSPIESKEVLSDKCFTEK